MKQATLTTALGLGPLVRSTNGHPLLMVVRGAAISNGKLVAAATWRTSPEVTARHYDMGFRLVRSSLTQTGTWTRIQP